MFEPRTFPRVLEVFWDADHAGDLGTRSGMAVLWISHLNKHGSGVQSTVALGSCESEYFALLTSSAHALGITAMLNDWHYGVKCEIHMRCDNSAARKLDMLRYVSCGYNKRTLKGAQCPDK